VESAAAPFRVGVDVPLIFTTQTYQPIQPQIASLPPSCRHRSVGFVGTRKWRSLTSCKVSERLINLWELMLHFREMSVLSLSYLQVANTDLRFTVLPGPHEWSWEYTETADALPTSKSVSGLKHYAMKTYGDTRWSAASFTLQLLYSPKNCSLYPTDRTDSWLVIATKLGEGAETNFFFSTAFTLYNGHLGLLPWG
jgi:hypothetical protein